MKVIPEDMDREQGNALVIVELLYNKVGLQVFSCIVSDINALTRHPVKREANWNERGGRGKSGIVVKLSGGWVIQLIL